MPADRQRHKPAQHGDQPKPRSDSTKEHRHPDQRQKARCRSEGRLGGDEQHRRADDGHDGDEVSKIQIGAVIRVEVLRDQQRRENLHEFGRLKLK